MHALLKSINYRKTALNHETSDEHVQVLLRSGRAVDHRWLGFIEVQDAKQLRGAKPVKLLVDRYNNGKGWVELQQGEHVQGCLVDSGVYAILEPVIRIVE